MIKINPGILPQYLHAAVQALANKQTGKRTGTRCSTFCRHSTCVCVWRM